MPLQLALMGDCCCDLDRFRYTFTAFDNCCEYPSVVVAVAVIHCKNWKETCLNELVIVLHAIERLCR